MTADNPLDYQVGGDHYRRLTMQPIEFAAINGLNCFDFSILRYVTRHRTKNGAQDVQKALQYVDLRVALLPVDTGPVVEVVPITAYNAANQEALSGVDRDALVHLSLLYRGVYARDYVEPLKATLHRLLAEYANE